MASLQLDILLNPTLDGAKLKTAFGEVTAAVDSVGKSLDKANVKGFADEFDHAAKASTDNLNQQKSALAGLIASGQGSSEAANKIRAGLASAAVEAKKLDAAMEEVEKDIAKSGESAQKSGGFLSSMTSGLVAGGGMALAQAGISAVSGAVSGLFTAALEADEIGDKMELAFRQSGLSGKALEEQLKSTTDYARKLGDQFAESPAKIKGISTAAASLGGATGKANEDLTKLALGIEKASDGAISGEAAIKIMTRGVADPENAAAFDKLTKKFPALGDAIKSTDSVAGKVNASLSALGPTFATLEAQSTGIDAIAARFQNAGTEAVQSLGGGIISGLDKAGAAIAQATGGFDFTGIFDTAQGIGETIGNAVSTAVVYILDFYEKAKPVISFITDVLVAQVKIQYANFTAIIGGAFQIVGKIFDTLQGAVQPLIDSFSSLFAGMGDGADYVQEFIDTFKEVINTVVDFAGIIIEFAVTPIKIFVAEIVAVVGWVSKLISSFKSTSDGAKDAGGSVEKAKSGFEKFREVLQTVQAFASGVAGALRGLANDATNLISALASFDLAKIKDAFFNFGDGAKTGFNDGWNQKKADIASDSLVKDFEKQIEEIEDRLDKMTDAELAAAKRALSEKVAAQKTANKISLDQATDLSAAISKLEKASGGDDKDLTKKAASKKDVAVKGEKDYTDAIAKAKLENAKIISDITAKGEEDESARERAAQAEKTKNAVAAIIEERESIVRENDKAINDRQKAIAKITANEKLTEAQKHEAIAKIKEQGNGQYLELVAELNRKIELVTQRGAEESLDLEKRIAQKQLVEQKKNFDEQQKQKIDTQKAAIEETTSLLKAADDAETRIALTSKLGEQKAALVRLQGEQEQTALVAKNKKLQDAETALIEARSAQTLAIQKAEANKVQNALRDSLGDAVIGAGAGFGTVDTTETTEAIITEAAAAVDAAQAIFEEAQKSVLETDAQILAASKKSAREQLEIMKATAAERDKLILDSSATYRFAMAIQLNLEKQFSDDAIAERKRIARENDKELKDAEDALFDSLKARTLDEKSYYSAVDELEKKRAAAAADSLDFFKAANTAFIGALESAAADASTAVDASAKKLKTLYATQSKEEAESTEGQKKQAAAKSALYSDLAASAAVSFASMLASGKSVSDSMIAIVIDSAVTLLNAMIPTWVAGIFGTTVAQMGPWGLALAAVATGTLMGLASVAKSALSGADAGVIGIDESYNKKPSHRDTIPILVRKGEAIVNTEATSVNHDVLEFINRTNRPAIEFFQMQGAKVGYDSPEVKAITQTFVVENTTLKQELYELHERFESHRNMVSENYTALKESSAAANAAIQNASNIDLVAALEQQTERLVTENQVLRAQLRQQHRGGANREPVPVNINLNIPSPLNSNWS